MTVDETSSWMRGIAGRIAPIGCIGVVLGVVSQLKTHVDTLGWIVVSAVCVVAGIAWATYTFVARRKSALDPTVRIPRYKTTDRLLAVGGTIVTTLVLAALSKAWEHPISEELEISDFSFTDNYSQLATSGEYPEFDLKLRNLSDDAVFVTEVRLVVEDWWKLRPTTFPVAKPTASLVLPSAVYELQAGTTESSTDFDHGQVNSVVASLGVDPEIKTLARKVSHKVPKDGVDRITLRYKLVRAQNITDPSTGDKTTQIMITPFYVLKMAVEVVYNDAKAVRSKPLIFAHFFASSP